MTDSMLQFLSGQPAAYAYIKGNDAHPGLSGLVTFYDFLNGTIVMADIGGLPVQAGECGGDFFGFHIHEGAVCGSGEKNPFAAAGGHLNPADCPHPGHMGDLPVLEGNGGRAWMAFYTERFRPEQVRGKTVVVHGSADDYRSQPAGDSGERIGCGQIM